MERSEKVKIGFFGREAGLILKEKLQEAGFDVVDPNRSDTDLIVVGYYGKILSKKILEIPRYGALNVHPSLLPKYRGPTPVQSAILNGETKTGVSIIVMDEEADHGPIIATKNFDIGDRKFTTPELTKKLWEMGGDLLVRTIPQWVAGQITPAPQDHSRATTTKLLTKENGRIDWNSNAEYIERQVRAYTPWPGTYTFWNGKLLKIHKARVSADQGTPGQIFQGAKGELGAHAKQGALIIEELQLEGKKRMDVKEFLLGHKNIIGQSLS